MPQTREKFATQVDGALLADLRGLAKQEGRPIQALVEEAIAALIEQRRQGSGPSGCNERLSEESRPLRIALQEARAVTRVYLTLADVLAINGVELTVGTG